MYKHSYGHYRTDQQAYAVMKQLQEEKPKLRFEVVREDRKKSKWNRYCVCVMVPQKQGKNRVKKSQKKVKAG